MQLTKEQFEIAKRWYDEVRPRKYPLLLTEDPDTAQLIMRGIAIRLQHGAPLTLTGISGIIDDLTQFGEYCGVRGLLKYATSAPHVPTAALAPPANQMPWIDEPLLKSITSMAAVRELTSTQLKMLSSSWPWDANGKAIVPISKKFEERVAWLKLNPNAAPQAPEPNVQPDNSPAGKARARVDAIRKQIEEATTGGKYGYGERARMQHARLNRVLEEILRDPSRQVFRDRSRGGIEVLKGIDAVERIMEREIRDADNPIR